MVAGGLAPDRIRGGVTPVSLESTFDRLLAVGSIIILCILLGFGAFTSNRSAQMDVSRSNELVFVSSRIMNNIDALRFVAKQAALQDPELSVQDFNRRYRVTRARFQVFKKGELHAIADPAIQKYVGQLDKIIERMSTTMKDESCGTVCRGEALLVQTGLAKRVVAKLQGRGLIVDGRMRRAVDEFNASTISRIFASSLAFTAFACILAFCMAQKNGALRAQKLELTESQHRLTEVGRYRGQFLAGMSHEFRTPLNAIKGFSQLILMLKAEMPREKLLEYMVDIEKSASDLEEITNTILDLSKIDAGTFDLYEKNVDLVSVLKDAKKQFEVGLHGQRLVLDLPNTLTAYCDPSAIKRSVQNLISNALKFSAEESRITIAMSASKDGVEIKVADQGCGIPEEELDSVWKVYSRSSYTRGSDKQGSGLGLPIIKALIEAHGGQAELQSKVGEGTVVTLTLPAHRLRLQNRQNRRAA